jgi:hypothetical protein
MNILQTKQFEYNLIQIYYYIIDLHSYFTQYTHMAIFSNNQKTILLNKK